MPTASSYKREPGRPIANEPSPFQREIIMICMTWPEVTKDQLARAMDSNHNVIRYQLQAIGAKRWLPDHVLDGIHARSRKHTGGKLPKQGPVRPSAVWADKIVTLLRNDTGAVERFARMFEGGAL